MFRVHAKFMMQGLYVLYMSADLRGRLNGTRPVERRLKGTRRPEAFCDALASCHESNGCHCKEINHRFNIKDN